MAFRNKEIETMPREDLQKLQLSLLKKEVRTMYDSSKFFHDKMKEAGLTPEDIDSFEAFRKVPMMKKTDLRDNYPDKLFVKPYEDLVRVHVSSGTTGRPTVVSYTQKDLDDWSECLARGMVAFGMSRKDMLQNFHGYGLFTGGLGVHYGAERIGATVLP
ncbi:MAG: phenylacetate--CoA ligase, partial [Candidatus Methanomethylophilaceae archaeon]